MKIHELFIFKLEKGWWVSFVALSACVLCNFMADLFVGTSLFYVFYQGIFVLGICIFFPVWLTAIKQKRPLATIGMTTHKWRKAVLVGVLIAVLATFGRMMNLHIVLPGAMMLFNILACMIMSTLFEEIFFRGFLQTRFERSFGMIPGILLSGFSFAIYHSAQRFIGMDIPELISLFCIGVFFSIAFRITQNIITSYIVNLPQAILTFIGEPKFIEYSKHFDSTSAVISLSTTVVALVVIIVINSRNNDQISHNAEQA